MDVQYIYDFVMFFMLFINIINSINTEHLIGVYNMTIRVNSGYIDG